MVDQKTYKRMLRRYLAKNNLLAEYLAEDLEREVIYCTGSGRKDIPRIADLFCNGDMAKLFGSFQPMKSVVAIFGRDYLLRMLARWLAKEKDIARWINLDMEEL